MQSQLERERQKLAYEKQKAEAARKALEEEEREKVRAEKRAAKEKRREEARLKEGGVATNATTIKSKTSRGPSQPHSQSQREGHDERSERKRSSASSCCWVLLWAAMTLILVTSAMAFSLIWIYTNGKLDQRSVEKAVPLIQRDVDHVLAKAEKIMEPYVAAFPRELGPVLKSAEVQLTKFTSEWSRRQKLLAMYVNENLGPYCCSLVHTVKSWLTWASVQAAELWETLRPQLLQLWSQWVYPGLKHVGDYALQSCQTLSLWVQKSLPVIAADIAENLETMFTRMSSWLKS